MSLDATSPGAPSTKRLVQIGTDPQTGLRIVAQFEWRVDRYIHKLSQIPASADDESPSGDDWLIQVADSDAHDPCWPSSPPLQQLDKCALGGGQQGLVGLGMAGTSHWSLAVVVEEQRLWFDVACRVQQPPGILQTTYRLDEGCEAVPSAAAGEDCVVIVRRSAAGGRLQLTVDAQTTEWIMGPNRRHIHLRPKKSPSDPPATIRWRYGFAATA